MVFPKMHLTHLTQLVKPEWICLIINMNMITANCDFLHFKMMVNKRFSAAEYKTETIHPGGSIRQDMKLDGAKENLYILTEDKVSLKENSYLE